MLGARPFVAVNVTSVPSVENAPVVFVAPDTSSIANVETLAGRSISLNWIATLASPRTPVGTGETSTLTLGGVVSAEGKQRPQSNGHAPHVSSGAQIESPHAANGGAEGSSNTTARKSEKCSVCATTATPFRRVGRGTNASLPCGARTTTTSSIVRPAGSALGEMGIVSSIGFRKVLPSGASRRGSATTVVPVGAGRCVFGALRTIVTSVSVAPAGIWSDDPFGPSSTLAVAAAALTRMLAEGSGAPPHEVARIVVMTTNGKNDGRVARIMAGNVRHPTAQA